MTHAAMTAPPLAMYGEELRAFLEQLPARLRGNRLDELRHHCRQLLNDMPKAESAQVRWAKARTSLQASLQELYAALDGTRAREYVLARYDEAARAYEQWRAGLTNTAEAPRSLAPLIPWRSVFHVSMALLGAGMYQLVLTHGQAMVVLLTLVSTFGALEISRRVWPKWNALLCEYVFGSIIRPRERHQINSSTWYLLALCLITAAFSKPAVVAAILVFGFGDPAAAWIGRRWGRLELYRNKTLLGTLGFFGAGVLVSGVTLFVFYPNLGVGARVGAALTASLLGAAAELFAHRLDDNLTVPIAAALGAALWL